MAEDVLLTKVENRVATITFNPPDKLYALSRDLIAQSIKHLNDNLRCFPLSAAFAAGTRLITPIFLHCGRFLG